MIYSSTIIISIIGYYQKNGSNYRHTPELISLLTNRTFSF